MASDGQLWCAEARRAPNHILTRRLAGWQMHLSWQPEGDLWFFSALLYPMGRSSTEKDWAVLGRFVASVGAPPDPPASVLHEPNVPHYWIWQEIDGRIIPLPKEPLARALAALDTMRRSGRYDPTHPDLTIACASGRRVSLAREKDVRVSP